MACDRGRVPSCRCHCSCRSVLPHCPWQLLGEEQCSSPCEGHHSSGLPTLEMQSRYQLTSDLPLLWVPSLSCQGLVWHGSPRCWRALSHSGFSTTTLHWRAFIAIAAFESPPWGGLTYFRGWTTGKGPSIFFFVSFHCYCHCALELYRWLGTAFCLQTKQHRDVKVG